MYLVIVGMKVDPCLQIKQKEILFLNSNYMLMKARSTFRLSSTRLSSIIAFVTLFSTALAGCEVIGDIFKAGVWTGVVLVVAVVGVVIWLVARSFS